MNSHNKRAWIAILFIPAFLISCATYNSKMQTYYANVQEHNYDKALRNLQNNKFIQRGRNALLYYMEMGKVYHLKKDYTNSNRYFNLADNFIESNGRKSMGDVVVANLLNPMQQSYSGEDFEQFMVHYYKALNYAALGMMEDAVVEARRITLSTNTQGEKFNNKENRYSKDAFALNLQGIIYEMAGDINNAFIAYRNAADVYLSANKVYYGVALPEQLKQDVLRTANAMGFTAEQQRYENIFGITYQPRENTNELVLFIEQGNAPIKKESNIFLTTSNGGANFMFIDDNGQNINLPFNYTNYGLVNNNLSDFRTFRVAIPKYEVQYTINNPASVTVNGQSFTTQTAQNMNTISTEIMRERTLTEMANALARQLAKKLVEKGVEKGVEAVAKKDDKGDAAKQEKNEKKAEAAGAVAGLIVNLVNTATEKADTRNWQSLPAFINYVRIPLNEGVNTITVELNGKTETLTVNADRKLQILNLIP